MRHHAIHGSVWPLPAGARRLGDADPEQLVTVTVVLRRVAPVAGAPASQEDIALVEEFAHEHGLTVGAVSAAARSVRLAGTVAGMTSAFAVELGEYEADGQQFRGRVGAVHVPDDLADVVVAVLGLDNRPQAEAHFRLTDGSQRVHARVVAPHAAGSGYPPQQVAARYSFPTDVTGAGQTVAVIELGGGYRTADLKAYFKEQGLPTPKVTAVSVDGARNSPGSDADGEVMLDIEVIGAIANKAAIVVYFAPNTTDGFYDAVAAAIHDTRRKPSVVSISWGAAEASWTAQAMDSYDALFADAGALGVTVYAAAGDNGSGDGASGVNVDFPASSPNVVGCGGTTLPVADDTETVWNELAADAGATGGGVSAHFALPGYQSGAGVPPPTGAGGRGVPDVAGNADPLTGYQVRVDGKDQVIGGTSAVAPLWAALTLLANQQNQASAGAIHKRLYQAPAAFRDITVGNNGAYFAGPGWDACTGLGSPEGAQVVAVLKPPTAG